MDIDVGSIEISLICTFKTKRYWLWVKSLSIFPYIFLFWREFVIVSTHIIYTNSMLKYGQCYTDLFSLLFNYIFAIKIF